MNKLDCSVLLLRKKLDDLILQIKSINYNKQFYLMHSNINKMVTDLSKLEVQHKFKPNHHSLIEKRQQILDAIKYLEQIIIIAKLSE